MTSPNWYSFALKEIDRAIENGRRLKPFEDEFLNGDGKNSAGIRRRVGVGFSLSEAQEKTLLRIHERMTEAKRIKW